MNSVIIKNGQIPRSSGGPSILDLRDIARQAELMLAAAHGQAEKIVSDTRVLATKQAEAIRQAAYDAGRAEGLAEGRTAGEETALAEARQKFAKSQKSLVSTLTKLLADFDERRETLYAAARRDVIVLAIAIAGRITNKLACMADVAPDAAVQACEEALAMLREATEVVVRTHPDDAAAIEDLQQQLARTMKSSPHMRIVEDAEVGRGGVKVQTADAAIDATISTRIERIADELMNDWRLRLKELPIKP